MEYKDKAIELANKTYFDFIELNYMGEYKGYEVYIPIVDEYAVIGLPIVLILNEDEQRATIGYEETFKFMSYFDDKEPIEVIKLKSHIKNKRFKIKKERLE